MVARQTVRFFQEVCSSYSAWTEAATDTRRKRNRTGLTERLHAKETLPLVVELDCHFQANWLARFGVNGVLKGVTADWCRLHTGLLWKLVSSEILLTWYDQAEIDDSSWVDLDLRMNSIAFSLGITRLVGWSEYAARRANAFTELYREDFIRQHFEVRDAEPFVLSLCCDDPALQPYWDKFDFGQYRFVWQALNDRRPLLADELLELCDYHCENIVDDDDNKPLPPFRHPPEDVFPVEILLIREEFQARGISFPSCEHPLLQTPLAKPEPIDTSMIDEPLLLDVARHFGFTDFLETFTANPGVKK